MHGIEMNHPKFVQITSSTDYYSHFLYALDEYGEVWQYTSAKEWRKV